MATNGEIIKNFLEELKYQDGTIESINNKLNRLTKTLNRKYYDTDSETQNMHIVGSNGRKTAISLSDVDCMFILPVSVYNQYNNYSSNGQSSLLQDVKRTIETTYSRTSLKGDGQVVVVDFTEIKFEILPAFKADYQQHKYIYPNSHDGGSWKATYPLTEVKAMNGLNRTYNYTPRDLCRMIRDWNGHVNAQLTGWAIDGLVYNYFTHNSQNEYVINSSEYYDYYLRVMINFFNYIGNMDITRKISSLNSPSEISLDNFDKQKAIAGADNLSKALIYYNQMNSFLFEFYMNRVFSGKLQF